MALVGFQIHCNLTFSDRLKRGRSGRSSSGSGSSGSSSSSSSGSDSDSSTSRKERRKRRKVVGGTPAAVGVAKGGSVEVKRRQRCKDYDSEELCSTVWTSSDPPGLCPQRGGFASSGRAVYTITGWTPWSLTGPSTRTSTTLHHTPILPPVCRGWEACPHYHPHLHRNSWLYLQADIPHQVSMAAFMM